MNERAQKIVDDYMHAHFPQAQYTSFVVWQARVLQNFKCLIAITHPYGMYFEVVYDGDAGRWFLDAYQKTDNVVIADD